MQVLFANLTNHFGRRTYQQLAGCPFKAGLNKTAGGNDAVLTNNGSVHHYRIHTH